jgi:hypothetical protein
MHCKRHISLSLKGETQLVCKLAESKSWCTRPSRCNLAERLTEFVRSGGLKWLRGAALHVRPSEREHQQFTHLIPL